MKSFAILILISLSFVACSATEEKPGLLPGHCIVNEDCPQQTRCNRETGWCEDIYFPREKIKNY